MRIPQLFCGVYSQTHHRRPPHRRTKYHPHFTFLFPSRTYLHDCRPAATNTTPRPTLLLVTAVPTLSALSVPLYAPPTDNGISPAHAEITIYIEVCGPLGTRSARPSMDTTCSNTVFIYTCRKRHQGREDDDGKDAVETGGTSPNRVSTAQPLLADGAPGPLFTRPYIPGNRPTRTDYSYSRRLSRNPLPVPLVDCRAWLKGSVAVLYDGRGTLGIRTLQRWSSEKPSSEV